MCCVTLTSLCINHQNVWIRKSDPMNFQCCHFTCTEDFPSSQSSLKNNILLNISHILTSHPRRITISIIRSCRGHWPLLLCCGSTFPLLNHFSVHFWSPLTPTPDNDYDACHDIYIMVKWLSVCPTQKSLFLYSSDLVVSHVSRHFPYSVTLPQSYSKAFVVLLWSLPAKTVSSRQPTPSPCQSKAGQNLVLIMKINHWWWLVSLLSLS